MQGIPNHFARSPVFQIPLAGKGQEKTVLRVGFFDKRKGFHQKMTAKDKNSHCVVK